MVLYGLERSASLLFRLSFSFFFTFFLSSFLLLFFFLPLFFSFFFFSFPHFLFFPSPFFRVPGSENRSLFLPKAITEMNPMFITV